MFSRLRLPLRQDRTRVFAAHQATFCSLKVTTRLIRAMSLKVSRQQAMQANLGSYRFLKLLPCHAWLETTNYHRIGSAPSPRATRIINTIIPAQQERDRIPTT